MVGHNAILNAKKTKPDSICGIIHTCTPGPFFVLFFFCIFFCFHLLRLLFTTSGGRSAELQWQCKYFQLCLFFVSLILDFIFIYLGGCLSNIHVLHEQKGSENPQQFRQAGLKWYLTPWF